MLSARILWLLKLSALLALIGCASGAALLLGPRMGATEWLVLGALALVAMGLAALWLKQADTEARTATSATQRALQLFEAHPEGQLCITHTGQISRANPAAHALLANGAAPLSGQSLWTLFTEADPVLAALDKARTRGMVRDMEFLLRRADGVREVSLSAAVLTADESGPMTLLVTLHDTSAARRAERTAREQAERSRALLDAATDAVLVTGLDGRILDCNIATRSLFGLSAQGLSDQHFGALFTDPALASRHHAHAQSVGDLVDAAMVIRPRDGQPRDVVMKAVARRNAEGTLTGVYINLRDVTEVRRAAMDRDAKEWVVAGIARLNAVFQVTGAVEDLARRIITELSDYAGAQVGAFYAREVSGDGHALVASHAFTHRKGYATRFLPGEGLLGQAVLERKQIHVADLPPGYLTIASGLGEADAGHLYITPLMLENDTKGVLELASIKPLGDSALEYLRQAAPMTAVALEAAGARTIAAAALAQAQQLASELEAQQDRLRATNAELEEQTTELLASEQKLQAQQTEIELANAELQQQNDQLEKQRNETEQARRTLVMQAQEVALASKYKSEFLANMSHELRTPLNSLLLLARSLRDNPDGNLSVDQVESASVIFDSGSDLLNIINEILDLSKIEAGKMELRLADVDIQDVARTLVSQFEHMAHAQGLSFKVAADGNLPHRLVTDPQRLGQILKNLIGNALKFTEQGSVSVRFARPPAETRFRRNGFDPGRAVAVHVTDTGIGIAENQQKVIFEAFQQADSGDRRRYGGTGLGLSISRELANLLGGEIHVSSTPGQGSTFTLFLPETLSEKSADQADTANGPAPAPASGPAPASPGRNGHRPAAMAAATPRPNVDKPQTPLDDDHGKIAPNDRVLLLIEDDLRFAKILIDHVRQRGFKCLHATSGESGLELARVYRPAGVVLDIELPGIDGWAVLSELKQDLSLRHIPVHIVSVEPASKANLGIGAIGHAAKPVAHEQIDEVLRRLDAASAHAAKRVLVIEDEPLMRQETVRVIGNGNVKADSAGTGREGLELLGKTRYDLVVMDLGLPDMSGVELLQTWSKMTDNLPPVIIHTVRELTMEEEVFLRHFSDSIIIKDVRSQERLIDEVALFLHRVVQELPEDKRQAIFHLRQSDEPLRGKKVLIVEDDMRTMFAMARMLAGHGVNPIKAENGERALAMLAEHPDTDLVLLDMMMPVMDGYEVARRLRQDQQFSQLPVIALTAKAMREDRQRCLEAGCTDYLSKPVDPDRLTSLMRVLMFR
jgi:PAS domain S-box-containing protein